jgi:hypothetical protein
LDVALAPILALTLEWVIAASSRQLLTSTQCIDDAPKQRPIAAALFDPFEVSGEGARKSKGFYTLC